MFAKEKILLLILRQEHAHKWVRTYTHTHVHFYYKYWLKEHCFSTHSYRLAPKYHFPNQFEDVYNALKWFLRKDILKGYGVDPKRIGISGDSAGGNLAAAATQRVCCLNLFHF